MNHNPLKDLLKDYMHDFQDLTGLVVFFLLLCRDFILIEGENEELNQYWDQKIMKNRVF